VDPYRIESARVLIEREDEGIDEANDIEVGEPTPEEPSPTSMERTKASEVLARADSASLTAIEARELVVGRAGLQELDDTSDGADERRKNRSLST
jgi:hypothetical protein